MAKSKIEWTEYSWNPVTGCTPASEGCQNCYARRMANRLRGRCGYPADDPFRVTLHPERLEEPLKWKKPRRVFVCSMSDLFHEDVHPYDIMQIFNVMAKAKQHTFLVLTKRPEKMLEFYKRLRPGNVIPGPYFSITGIGEGWAGSPPRLPDNIWLGITAENQQRADERIPILLQIPAAVRFVSVEPMLGPVDLSLSDGVDLSMSVGTGLKPGKSYLINSLDWVICGGETGPGARPMHPDWVRSLVLQCKNAGVPFFFKQHGEWLHETQGIDFHEGHKYYVWPDESMSFRVGKKQAGRILDGRTWDEMPEI